MAWEPYMSPEQPLTASAAAADSDVSVGLSFDGDALGHDWKDAYAKTKKRRGARFVIPLLVPEGVPTGDGRIFKPMSVTHRALPLPLMWQIKTGDGHDGSPVVGRIDSITRLPNGLGEARGVFDTGPYGQEAERMVREGFLWGVSADLDNFEAVREDPVEIAMSKKNSEDGEEDDSSGINISNPRIEVSNARVMGATLVPKPAFQEVRIVLEEDDYEDEDVMDDVDDIDDMLETAILSAQAGESALTAAAEIATHIPVTPPAQWFDNPQLTKPTALTVTDDGRVFGHIAAWHVDHIGQPWQRPPKSKSRYAYFHTGVVRTAESTDIPVGQLTLAGGHAPLHASAEEAVHHYDNTASAIADVHAGEDMHGIWVAGALRPGTTAEQIRVLRASAPSGDWRPINGKLELVAICQVNVPGFPIARAMVASGKLSALVAAGAQSLAVQRLGYLNPDDLDSVESSDTSDDITLLTARVYGNLTANTAERVLSSKYSEAFRDIMANLGDAMSDGTLLIHEPADIRYALAIYRELSDDKKVSARRHIRARARDLGKLDMLPEEWNTSEPIREEFDALVASIDPGYTEFRMYSKDTRAEYAKKGWARKDGSYPIRDVGDLRRAIRAYGRASKSERADVRRHIARRARALDRADLIPAAWDSELTTAELAIDRSLTEAYLTLRNYSPTVREDYAKKGWAREDGSYPIANVADLKRAIKAHGRAREEDRAAVKKHIIMRARALKREDLIPEMWMKAATVRARVELSKRDIDAAYIEDWVGVLATAAERKRQWEESKYVRDRKGRFREKLASLREALTDKEGTKEAVDAIDRAIVATDEDDLRQAKIEADKVIKTVDDVADQTVDDTDRNSLRQTGESLGRFMSEIGLPQGDEAEKMRYTDLPKEVTNLVEDLLKRLRAKVAPDIYNEIAHDLETFMSGGDYMSSDEIHSNLAKVIRMLV